MITIYGKQVPTEAHELVDPTGTALVIIDYQNDCCSEGGTGDKAGADLSMYKTTYPENGYVCHALPADTAARCKRRNEHSSGWKE